MSEPPPDQDGENPYAAPAVADAAAAIPRDQPWHRDARLLGKWALVVTVNTATGWYYGLSLDHSPPWIAGMLLGVLTWWLIYCVLDRQLQRAGRDEARQALLVAALVKAGLQAVFILYMVLGMLTMLVVSSLFGPALGEGHDLLEAYLITVLTGGTYSAVVALVFTIAHVLLTRRRQTASRRRR